MNSDDSNKKCDSRSYGWLLNLDHAPWFLNPWRAWHRYLTLKAKKCSEKKVEMTSMVVPCMLAISPFHFVISIQQVELSVLLNLAVPETSFYNRLYLA
jgi:hypothetical protein